MAFTDDDCVCDANWLASIRAEYAADPTVLGVYGRVVPYGPPRQGLICPCVNESTEWLMLEGPAIPHLALGGGNNMSFRKEVFRKVGMFIESLGAGTRIAQGEDTEFSYRVLWNHCKIVYSPVPVVEHDNWLDRAQFTRHDEDLRSRPGTGVPLLMLCASTASPSWQLLRTAYYLLCDRMAIGSVTKGLFYFAQGLTLGPFYTLLRPPRFA